MNKVNTLEAMFEIILSNMTISDKEMVKHTREEDLILYHHNIGMQIRNKFKLWESDNLKLKKELNLDEGAHPDEVSQAIIVEFWKQLNKGV